MLINSPCVTELGGVFIKLPNKNYIFLNQKALHSITAQQGEVKKKLSELQTVVFIKSLSADEKKLLKRKLSSITLNILFVSPSTNP